MRSPFYTPYFCMMKQGVKQGAPLRQQQQHARTNNNNTRACQCFHCGGCVLVLSHSGVLDLHVEDNRRTWKNGCVRSPSRVTSSVMSVKQLIICTRTDQWRISSVLTPKTNNEGWLTSNDWPKLLAHPPIGF